MKALISIFLLLTLLSASVADTIAQLMEVEISLMDLPTGETEKESTENLEGDDKLQVKADNQDSLSENQGTCWEIHPHMARIAHYLEVHSPPPEYS